MNPWRSLKLVDLLIKLLREKLLYFNLFYGYLTQSFTIVFGTKSLLKNLTVVQHIINQVKIFKTLVYVKVQAHTQDSVQIDVTTSRLVRWWLIRRTPFIIRTGPEESKVTERRVPRTFDYVFLLLCDFNWRNWKWQVL